MSNRYETRRLSSAVWLALWGSLSLASCRDGSDVYLGRVTTRSCGTSGRGGSGGGSGSGSGSGGSALCGAEPCATWQGTQVFVDPSADASSADLFGRALDMPPGSQPEREPTVVYPSHETMFPVNARNVRNEWQSGENSLFELEFKGPNTTVRVYTQATNFVPTDEQWDWIAESNRGGTVTLTVRGLDLAAPSAAFRSSSISLHFSAEAVEGAIYYWSTAGKGVMKALISDPNPVKFYPDPASAETEKCAGCHALSRDGKRLAVALGPELRVVSVPERELVLPMSSGVGGAGGADPMKGDKAAPAIPAGWSTFSPDGSRILLAAAGKMSLLDATTGATIGPPEAIAVPGKFATHPDWSALGDRVAFTLAGKGGDKEVEAGSIALAPFSADAFGPLEVVVPSSGGGDNNFFPVWSPDSRFLAYVNTSGKSQDSKQASVRLFDVEARRVIALSRLNQRVNNQDGVMKMGNSMPTWAPSTTGGPFWLAFSSIRPYASLRPEDKKSDQLWIAAIDPSLEDASCLEDPSYPAFWAPFQSIEQGNHRAFWTHTGEDQQCRCVDICGDKLDNDCDGTADEADCVASCAEREICGDGVDNDCDCVVDDCASEICDDGIDNDGDGRTDAADPSCGKL